MYNYAGILICFTDIIKWKQKKDTEAVFFFLLQSCAGLTQIWGLTLLAWQCTRKVIRAASVSNPSEHKTFPISVRLMVKGETLCCVARHEEISTRGLDSSRHTTVFIIFLVFVWVSAIKADLLCLCLYVLPLQWWSKRGFCSKIQCVCSAQREPFFKVMPSSSRSYLEKKQTKNMRRGHTVQYTSKTTCAGYTRKKSVLVDELMKTDYNPTDAQLWLKKTKLEILTGFSSLAYKCKSASLGFRLLMIKQEIWR